VSIIAFAPAVNRGAGISNSKLAASAIKLAASVTDGRNPKA
jgi:hypothetical protein